MKHDIFFDPESHVYLVDGQEVPSVTTILQPLSNRSYSSVNPSVLEYARNRGTAVHEALEAIDLGAEPDIYTEIVPYIQAYEEWKSIYRPTWVGVEQIVYNDFEHYIGTLDRMGWLNGNDLAIIDIKTSQPTKEALVSVCLQTMAYKLAEDCDKDQPFEVNKRYGLFLKSDGSFRMVDCAEYEKKYNIDAWVVWHKLLDTHKTITELLATGKGKHGTD